MKKGSVIMLLIVAFAMIVPGALAFKTSGLVGNSGFNLGGAAIACANAQSVAWTNGPTDTPIAVTATATTTQVYSRACAASSSQSLSIAAVIESEEEEEENPCPGCMG